MLTRAIQRWIKQQKLDNNQNKAGKKNEAVYLNLDGIYNGHGRLSIFSWKSHAKKLGIENQITEF